MYPARLTMKTAAALMGAWLWSGPAVADDNVSLPDATRSECGWQNSLTSWSNFQSKNWDTAEKTNGSIRADHFLEVWHSSSFKGTLTYEEVGLPDGRYTVEADVFTNASCRIDWMAGDKRACLKPSSALLHHVKCNNVDVRGGRLVYGIDVVDASTWVGVANVKIERSGTSLVDTVSIADGAQRLYYSLVTARVPQGITARPVTGLTDGAAIVDAEVEVLQAGTPYLLAGEGGTAVYVSGTYTTAATEPQVLAGGMKGTHTGAWVPAGSTVCTADGGVTTVDRLTWVPAGSVWVEPERTPIDYSAVTEWDGIDWMAGLDDNRLVCQLSIPGTHDTATGSGFTGNITLNGSLSGLGSLVQAGPKYAQTQETTIPQQLEQGIRALDLRPSVKAGDLQIHHGIVETKLSWDQTMAMLTGFLDAHPTEFLVIHMRHEDDGDTGDGDWNAIVKQKLSAISSYLVDFKPTLTVGEMRGKMLIISRQEYDKNPTGGYFSTWIGDNANLSDQARGRIWSGSTRGVCYVQDYSNAYGDENGVSKKDIKRNAVLALLEHSTQHVTTGSAEVEWTFNFASAYSKMDKLMGSNVSSSDGYRDNAASTNTAIYEFLQTHTGPTGIILMDYAGVDKTGSYQTNGRKAVGAIIANNFKATAPLPAPPRGREYTALSPVAKLTASPLGETGEGAASGFAVSPYTLWPVIGTTSSDKSKYATTVVGAQDVEGWTRSKATANTGVAAGVSFTGWCNGALGAPEYVAPATAPEQYYDDPEMHAHVLGMVASGGKTVQYTRPVTLEQGRYTITIPIYNVGPEGGEMAQNLMGFVADDGTEALATATSYPVGEWVIETVQFDIVEPTDGVLSLGYKAPTGAVAKMPRLWVERVELTHEPLPDAIATPLPTVNIPSTAYDLLGRPVPANHRGIRIQHGKKIRVL